MSISQQDCHKEVEGAPGGESRPAAAHQSGTVLVRRADEPDAPVIAAVLEASFEPYRAQYTAEAYRATVLDTPRIEQRLREGPVWVAVCSGAVVATVSAVATGEGLYVRSLAVLPAVRRCGIARRLLSAVEAYAKMFGIGRMYLSTTPFLDAATHLYEGAGFTFAHVQANNLVGTTLIAMEKHVGFFNPAPGAMRFTL